MVGYLPNGVAFKIYVDKEGNASMSTVNARGPFYDRGRYVIEGDLLCATWEKVRNGQKSCLSVFRAADTFRAYNPDGSLNATYQIQSGNPENL